MVCPLGGRDYGLHCGEHMELYVGGNPLPCRLELDRYWYVCMKDVRFNLRETDKYLVTL